MSEAYTATADDTVQRADSVRKSEPLPMTGTDLPPADTDRWVVRRKAQVVHGVRNGIISLAEACKRYRLSIEEFETWERLIDRHGLRGLRVTRIKEYRGKSATRPR